MISRLPSFTVRLLWIAVALTAAGGRPARADRVDELSRVLVRDSSWRVRLQAAVILGKLHDGRAVPALERALADPNETVRGVAAQLLGDLGRSEALALLERAELDPSPFVRSRASAAVKKLRPAPVAAAPRRGELHVEVGGVGARNPNVSEELRQRLREFITRELSRTPGLTIEGKPLSGFLIDSSITQLDRQTNGPWVEVSCEVSLIVGRLPSKAMVMMTSGGATVQAPKLGFRPDSEQALQIDALEGAVHGAHENLIAYLRAQQ